MTRIFDTPIDSFQTKADIVYDRICSAILDGSVGPGERLNVDEIVRELGVSKIPVREALQRLETQGLVLQTPHAGARVAPVSLRELKGIFLIRIALEGLATRLAALRIGEDELAELRAVHAEMAAQHAAGELGWMSHQNRRFHNIIARAAGYTMLEELIETTLLSVARYRLVIRVEPQVWGQILDEHETIISALAERDPDKAEQAAKDHVNRQLQVDIQRQIDQVVGSDGSGEEAE